PPLSSADPGQGGRARAGNAGAAAPAPGRPAPAVARRAGARSLPAAHAHADGVHRPRFAAAPDGAEAVAVEDAACTFRPGRRAQRAGTPGARRARRGRHGHPAPGLSERPGTGRRRTHAPVSRDDPPVQGARRCDRGGEADRRRATARRRRSARARERVPRGGGSRRGAAPRLPPAARGRGGAGRGDCRALPVSPGARPERRVAAGTRRGCAGGRLRRRRHRRADPALRSRAGRAGRRHRGACERGRRAPRRPGSPRRRSRGSPSRARDTYVGCGRYGAPRAVRGAAVRLRRARFADLIDRQLDLFERENRGLIDDCIAAERSYTRAERDEAEERYGDYVDLVETGTEVLADLRDNFATTLEDDAADEYIAAFNRAVLKRFRRFALEIEDR